MIRYFLPLIFLQVLGFNVVAQDTLVAHDAKTRGIRFIPPVSFLPSIVAGTTTPAVGTTGKITELPSQPPTTNLYSGSAFSKPKQATSFFDIAAYPASTVVSIRGYVNGNLINMGTGTMIGENVVLTAGHVIYDFMAQGQKLWFCDSVFVFPSLNNGKAHPDLPVSKVAKSYIFKKFYDHKSWDDIALLELDEPIGRKTGWLGMAFNADTSFFRSRVFHKFSYPGTTDMFETPPRVYNGDTLYYNYGLTVQLPNTNGQKFGLGIKNAWAVPGQSGSSLFCKLGDGYYSFGVLNWSMEMIHYQINSNVFHQFKHIMEYYIPRPEPEKPFSPSSVYFGPNPFQFSTTLFLPNPAKEIHSLLFMDTKGKMVRKFENITVQEFKVERGSLASGMYFYQVWKAGKLLKSGKIMAQ